MIAFIQPPEESTRRPALRRAHHLLATTLLPPSHDSSTGPRIGRWRAWLFVVWLVAVAVWGCYRTMIAIV